MAKISAHVKAKLDVMDEVFSRLKDLDKMQLKVGFLDSKSMDYKDGTSVVEVAVQNEFGGTVDTTSLQKKAKAKGLNVTVPKTMQVPPRPFFRNAMDKNQAKYGRLVKQYFGNKGMGKDKSADVFLNQLGSVMQIDIMKSIDDTHSPENSPLTEMIKESSHPLIDTGHMRQSVSWQVKDKDGETDS